MRFHENRKCFHEKKYEKVCYNIIVERKAIIMLENILLVIATLILAFISLKGIIYLVTFRNDNFSYSRDEEKKACNYKDYQYCDKLK